MSLRQCGLGCLVALFVLGCGKQASTEVSSLDKRITITMPHEWTELDALDIAPDQATYEHKPTNSILGIRSSEATRSKDVPDTIDTLPKMKNGAYLMHQRTALEGSRSLAVLAKDSKGTLHVFTITLTGDKDFPEQLWNDLESAVTACRFKLP